MSSQSVRVEDVVHIGALATIAVYVATSNLKFACIIGTLCVVEWTGGNE